MVKEGRRWLICYNNIYTTIVYAAAAAKSLQSCPTLQPHRWQPTRLPCPWDSPGKNTGVGCHFLLQRMKVKSKSKVVRSCLTLHDPMDCSLTGSSIHGIFQARVLEWGAIAFSTTSALQEYKWSPTGCHFSFALIFIYCSTDLFHCSCIRPVSQIKGKILKYQNLNQVVYEMNNTHNQVSNWEIHILLISRKPFREGNGTPLQYSCLENPMDRGTW